MHRPPNLTLESNIALPGYCYLFYQIIIGFSSDVYMPWVLATSACFSFNSLYSYVVNIGHTSQSHCLSNAQITKAKIRIKHCSSRISYLFYQIIIGFSSDVYLGSGNQCLFVIQLFIPLSILL